MNHLVQSYGRALLEKLWLVESRRVGAAIFLFAEVIIEKLPGSGLHNNPSMPLSRR